ncbi:MAG: O-antigen ligase family protein [Firmicutes bacterium]|nr:O-antigen ligase family protein [Bacillota bacterium]
MSSKQKHRKHQTQKPPAHAKAGLAAPEESRADYLAVLPGLLLCAMTLLILLMDLALPGMAQEQYTNFPALFRMTHAAIIAAGVLFWVIWLVRRKSSAQGLQGLREVMAPAHAGEAARIELLPVLFFGLFLVWILLSTAVNGLDEKALHGVSYRNLGIFHFLSLILIYLFVSSQVKRASLRQGLLAAFLLVSDLAALAALADHSILAIPAFAQKKELSAIFFNGNHYGYFLTMAVLVGAGLFLCRQGRRMELFGLISMLLNFAVLLLNHSLGCLLAAGISMGCLLVLMLLTNRAAARRLGILLGCFAGLLLLGLLALAPLRSEFADLALSFHQVLSGDDAGSAGHNRWMLWGITCDLISQRPVFGYGCEGISDILMSETGRANPHNEVLTYAAFFGIPGAAFYVLGLVSVFAAWLRCKIWRDPFVLTAALAALGYFLSSLFGVPMFYTAPFFFVFLGLSLGRLESPDPS